jgi:hypothetical protein
MPTTSHDPTAPSTIHLLQPIHQQHTQNNNLLAILEDYAPDNNDESITDDITIQAINQKLGATLSFFLQQISELTRCTDTQMVSTNPNSSIDYNLQPTTTPTLHSQP